MVLDFRSPAPLPPATIAAAFGAIMRGLWTLLGLYNPARPRARAILEFRSYLNRTAARFARLLARHAAGILRPPVKRLRTAARRQSDRPRLRLPRGRMWVLNEMGWQARGHADLLGNLLARPDTAAIVAAHPQAQRLLRPVCHALGLTPACVPPLPRRPRKPRPPSPAKPRRLTRKQREAILWYPNSEGRPMQLLPKKLPRD